MQLAGLLLTPSDVAAEIFRRFVMLASFSNNNGATMAEPKPELLQALSINASDAAYLSALTAAQQDSLIATIQQTSQQHHDEIMQAMENAANNVPRLFRGAFRKMFS